MSAVEVMKGPASIQYGPHTVGGALNLVTQPISLDQQGMLEAVFGSDDYQKYRASYKDQIGQFAYSVDLLRYSANGFKDLDEGGDTGFVRNDLNIKVEWNSAETATYQQKLQFKMGYADEDSNETYLGLTDADLKATPDRRYISSKLDRFVSDHTQAHLLHSIKLNSDLSFFTKAYVNRFDRSWNKFDGLIGGPSANTALARPDVFTTEIALLRGEIDSSEAGSQLIDVTDNDRKYGSQGIEVSLNYDYAFGAWQHNFQGGVRFHNDYVDRDHHQRGYSVVNKNLIFDGINSRTKKALNNASTDATAFYLNDRIDIGQWTLNTGIRIENIQGEYQDFLNDSIATNNQTVVIPGFGAHWQWRDDLGFFVGVNSGFSPAAPTAGSEAESEKSTNFEYGLRYNSDYNIEMVGFYSDYSNLIGRCRVSDPNCSAGQEFSAGDVDIAGAELSGSRVFEMKNGWIVPIEFAYTYTESAFQNSFLSSFSQWGNVVSGDELPYLPKHNARLQIGIENHQFSFNAALRYVSEMREIAGQGVFEEGNFTPKHTIIDMSASWFVNDDWRFQLVAENITNKRVIVARRPIGARPTAPSLIRLGVQYQF
tara:strand:- start:5212 stop:6999 length:1788 start_codon:yes stop_codon:yes gene_type:complete